VTSTNDPTAHGEVVAIRRACTALKNFSLASCTIYTSCEPCPMCLGSIYWSRINRVVYANTRKDASDIGFDDEFIYDQFTKKIKDRSVEHDHMPSEAAINVFKAWANKKDKIRY
jgi:tRNA(Arg) A34 adenosine deaminase TadA